MSAASEWFSNFAPMFGVVLIGAAAFPFCMAVFIFLFIPLQLADWAAMAFLNEGATLRADVRKVKSICATPFYHNGKWHWLSLKKITQEKVEIIDSERGNYFLYKTMLVEAVKA